MRNNDYNKGNDTETDIVHCLVLCHSKCNFLNTHLVANNKFKYLVMGDCEHLISTNNMTGTLHCCSVCDMRFISKQILITHLKCQHMIFGCTQCSRTYHSRSALYSHTFVHSNVENFRCNQPNCDKSFKSPKQLAAHKRSRHTQEQRYVCEQCGYRTSFRCNLFTHQRTHTGEKSYCCEMCGKCFVSMNQLNMHKTIHTQRFPQLEAEKQPYKQQYCCIICGAKFNQSRSLYHHKTLHLPKKKYICHWCGRQFAQAAGLCSHKRLHFRVQKN